MNYRDLYETTVKVLLKYSAKHGQSLNLTHDSLLLLHHIQEDAILSPSLQEKIKKYEANATTYLDESENFCTSSYESAVYTKSKKTPLTSLIKQSLSL
tara:strand:+ start:2733 stop:3026 length:294 start_codon:yes stop_codon:yes gene_type:complete